MTLLNNQSVTSLITKGYFSLAKNKLNDGKGNVNEVDQEGRNSLILCSFINDTTWSTSLARFVLQIGVDVRIRDYTNEMNVFHYCCILERVELLEMLLESVDFDINTGDSYGNSPLIYAIAINNPKIVNLLISFYKKYKINVDVGNLKGVNALMEASLIRNLDLINELIKMGADENVKDNEGQTAAHYKDNAILKSNIITQFNEKRRQSRLVRFDNIELMVKLQQDTASLREEIYKMSENNDPIVDRMKSVQIKIKEIKRNKIDVIYTNKSLKNTNKHNKTCESNNDTSLKRVRLKTTVGNSRALREKNDWYSIVGPLFFTLEQQYAPSFRAPIKHEELKPSQEILTVHHKQRGRRFSHSTGSLNNKNLISCRSNGSEDNFNSGSGITRSSKKIDECLQSKTLIRNFSRLGIQSSCSSVNNEKYKDIV